MAHLHVSPDEMHKYEMLCTRELESGHDSELEDDSDSGSVGCLLNADEQRAAPRERQPEWLPAWLFTARFGIPAVVTKRMESKQCEKMDNKLTMFDVAGPPMKWLWFSTVVYWTYSIVLPWFAYRHIQCTTFGHFRYPLWLWWTFVPVLMTLVIVEWRCVMYTIVPVAQWLKGLSVPLVGEASFKVWLAFTGFQSLTSHADVVTQGLFLASTCRSISCPGWSKIYVAWETVWASSPLSWISAGKDLKVIMLLSWSVLVVQLPLYVVGALPCRCVDYRMGFNPKSESGHHDQHEARGEPEGYETWTGVRIWHADAIKCLANVNRMAVLNEGQFELSLQRAREEVTNDDARRGLHILGQTGRGMFLRAVLTNLCQNCTKLELQTTIFALGHMIQPEDVDFQVALSLVLANATSLQALMALVRKIRMLREQKFLAWEQMCQAAKPLPALYEYMVVSLYDYLTLGVILVCVLVQLHSITKFAMAFVCQDALWNLPNKCVDVPGF
ncbi:unnamed protein product [Effrenium voratum]|nr:unnamed protein product [Effrenium voratum]